jgi:hypothetical protein
VTVPVTDDQLDESDEVFDLVLSNPTNATLGRGRGRATIRDDDPLPTLAVADASTSAVLNGNGVRFTVTLSAPSGRGVSVAFATSDGTALAGTDYVAKSGRVAFRPGETTATFDVTLIQDLIDEPDKAFTVTLSAPLDAEIADGEAVGSVPDDDPAPNVSVDDVSVDEGDRGTTAATFTVSLSRPSAKTVTVRYATASGTARSGTDFEPASGTVAFAPGQDSKPVIVRVLGDRRLEPDETFSLTLTAPVNAFLQQARGTATIVDDDSVAPPKPGVSANLKPASGVVTVRVGGRVVPLSQLASIPFGATVDATRGRVGVTTADGAADFYSGAFVLRSERVGGARVTTLTLAGGSFAACPKVTPKAKPRKKARKTRRPAALEASGRTVVRRLWGSGKGRFRTRGRFASATVRGTVWLIEDRCDGTRIVVRTGRVAVLDPRTKKTVLLGPHRSLLVPRT